MESQFITLFKHAMQEEHISSDNISHLEYASFYSYTGHSYDLANYMRVDRPPFNEVYEGCISAMMVYLDRSPKVEKIALYRGTRLPNLAFNEVIQTGRYCDNAFLSATDSYNDARRHMCLDSNEDPEQTHMMVLFTINIHFSGVSVKEFSSIQGIDGNEVLFAPKTTFEVIDYKEAKFPFSDGINFRTMYNIVLKEVIHESFRNSD